MANGISKLPYVAKFWLGKILANSSQFAKILPLKYLNVEER